MSDASQEEEKEFLAEAEVMDLSPIKDLTFAVAVSTGDPRAVRYLCTTLHGPYSFVEMAQEVGDMWMKHQHHSRVIILNKDANAPVRGLDANTLDYIEAHYVDIIMEETLAGIPEDRVFTCTAGTIEEQKEEKK